MALAAYKNSKVFSNAAFALPLAVAALNGLYFHAFLLMMVMVFSSLYHASRQTRWQVPDAFFAWALITYNGGLTILAHFAWPFFPCSVASVAVALYFFYYKRKDDWEWHLASAMITLFSQLTYLYH